MKYKVTHKTTYVYGETVPVCHNQVYLAPRGSRHQTCRQHRLSIKPMPTVSENREDYFGNETCFFSIEESHRRLSVTAVSRVDVRSPAYPEPSQTPHWDTIAEDIAAHATPSRIAVGQFVFRSPSISWFPDIEAYTRESFPPGRPILEAAVDLMARIHDEFKYDPAVTTVQTPVEEVFQHRHGVCQDFAHLMIACLRSIGLAARYVSGYLRTVPPEGEPRLVGADASHAWLAVYCGGKLWVGVDPTNNCLISEDHITLAWGRDYTDVCPIKGVYVGGSIQNMTVSVDVLPLTTSS